MAIASRPTIAEINLRQLKENFHSCRRFFQSDLKIMAVVKADAYGHRAVECSLALSKEGVDWFGVATPEEALELRSAGIKTPILCLGSFWPGQEVELIANKITPAIFEIRSAKSLNAAAATTGTVVPVHIKIDTGMGRLGFRWDSTRDLIETFKSFKHLKIQGVMTHFASADDLEEIEFTNLQIMRFDNAVAAVRAAGHSPEIVDLSNSPGSVTRGPNGGNLIRLGGILYGLFDDILPRGIDRPELKPVMSVRSQIAHLKTVPANESIGYGRSFVTRRESRVAAIPIGYYDGYRRAMSNRGRMIVRGRFVPVIGRVSMDWTMIDVTDVPAAAIGDEVTVVGADGASAITAEDLAALMDTISYEVTCAFSSRVPRIFVGEQTA